MSKTRSKKSERVTLVLATLKPYTRHNIPHYEVASYQCSCGHKGAVHAGLETPHCANCGSGVTAKQVTNASVTRIEEESSSVSLLCPDCDTHNLMATSSAIDFDGSVHCASCGGNLQYDVADVQEDDEDEDVNLDNDTGSDDFADQISADLEGDDDNDDSEDEDVEEAGLDDDDVDIEDLVEDADLDEDDNEDVTDADDYIGGDIADDVQDDETEDDLEDEAVLSKVKPIAVASIVGQKALAKVRIVTEANCIHLFAKDACIATLKSTPENTAVFGKKSHLQLIQASLDEAGYAPTVEKFGFELSKVRLTKQKALESTVASIQTKAQAKIAAKLKDSQAALRQSLEIAAVGFNRDAFAATMSNPLKDGFHDMLVGLGVDPVTASIQVQNVFATAGDQYSEQLLAKANEIASYAPEVRNQLASTFASIAPPTPNLQVTTHAGVEDDEDEDESDDYFADEETGCSNSVTARLDKPMRASSVASTSTSTAPRLFSRSTIR